VVISPWVKRTERETNHPHPSSDEVKSASSYNSILTYYFKARYLVKHRENLLLVCTPARSVLFITRLNAVKRTFPLPGSDRLCHPQQDSRFAVEPRSCIVDSIVEDMILSVLHPAGALELVFIITRLLP
jgi:hypothetical protein